MTLQIIMVGTFEKVIKPLLALDLHTIHSLPKKVLYFSNVHMVIDVTQKGARKYWNGYTFTSTILSYRNIIKHCDFIHVGPWDAPTSCKGRAGTTQYFTVGFFHSFSLKANHLRSSKIRFYSVLLHMNWDYKAKGPNVRQWWCQLPIAKWWNKTMFLFAKLGFLHWNQKPNALAGKSWNFPHPWCKET